MGSTSSEWKLLSFATYFLLAALAVGCSDSADGSSGDTGSGSDGGDGKDDDGDADDGDADDGGDEVEEVKEKEPNDGPTYQEFQDIGTFTDSKTVRLSGRLDSGGNDGTSYTGDFDVFAFTVAEDGGTLDLVLDWAGGADVDIVVYDKDLNGLSSDGGTTKPIASSGPLPKGSYAVALFSKDDPADWTLSLDYSIGGPGDGRSCVSPLQPTADGGCEFTMNEPAQNGAAITLPYTFGWRSDGCETPGKAYFYGNPPTEDNGFYVEYTRGGQESLLNVTGDYTLTAADLATLRSDNGVYHWQLESFYGGRSVGWTFTVDGEACQ